MRRNPLVKKGLAVVFVAVFVGLGISTMSSGLPMKTDSTLVQTYAENLRDENDTTPPLTTISFNPAVPNGLNGWYVSDVLVTLNATDNGSGVWRTYCSLLPPGATYTKPILISRDGIYYIYYYSIDYAGNVEVPKSVSVRIDTTPPLLNVTVERTGWREWIVKIYVYDELSGSDRMDIYINGLLQVTIDGLGPYYEWSYYLSALPHADLSVMVRDGAGNYANSSIDFTSLSQHQLYRPAHESQINHIFYSLRSLRLILLNRDAI